MTEDERDWVNQIREAEGHRDIPVELTRSRRRLAQEGATTHGG